MAISSLFAKFKGLGPVLVVGTAVLVTVKLLTTKTPTTEESFVVKVEEDIKTEDYKEDIVIPEPEPEPQQEKPAEEQQDSQAEDTAEDTEQDEEEAAASEEGEEDEAEEKEDKEEEKEKEEKPATKLKFREDGIGALLGRILKPSGGKG